MPTLPFDSSNPSACRRYIEFRLGRRATRVLRYLEKEQPHFPKLNSLPEDRARVLEAYGRRCAYCGTSDSTDESTGTVGTLGIDLLVPTQRGGTPTPENMVAACANCRHARHGRHLDAFLEEQIQLDPRAVYARIGAASAILRTSTPRSAA